MFLLEEKLDVGDAGCRLSAALASCGAAARRGTRGGRHGDIIAPQHPPARTASDGWQAGTCSEEPPESAADLLGRHPGAVLRTRRRPPELGLHPVHRQAHDRDRRPARSPRRTGRGTGRRPRRPAGRPQRQPGGDRTLSAGDLRSRRERLPGGIEGRRKLGHRLACSGCRRRRSPASPRSPSTTSIPQPGEPARFGLELAGNEVFLEGDLDWAGDYHEGFTIAVPKALPVGRSKA